MNNEIDFYSIEKAAGPVMKNFVAFTFNPDSLEKLENYVYSKNIEESWIAFSFWCSYNGFANISRNFTKPVLDTDKREPQDYIDNYLQHYLSVLQSNPPVPVDETPYATVVAKKSETTDKNSTVADDKVKTFYDQYVQDKYKISIEEFYPLMQIRDLDQFIVTVKEKFKISKKDSSKLYHQLAEYFNPSSLFS
jgi:hypothetical protein